MSRHDDAPEDDFALDSDFPEPAEGGGPPDDWGRPTYFNYRTREFWRRMPSGTWQVDPPPVRPLGYAGGDYWFVTGAGEVRAFTSAALHGRGGLADLFGGKVEWAARHFPARDREGMPTGRPNAQLCMERLISICVRTEFMDGSLQVRGVGTWRGPDGLPIVHAGDRIFHDDRIWDPGAKIGEALYVIGGRREPPLHVEDGKGGYEWTPADSSVGRTVTAHLDEWAWDTPEERDLFQGSLYCNMLCAALTWLPHVFVLAPYGSGKSSLLRYARALVGGAGHPVQKTYSKAWIEQHFSATAGALFLDEMESDQESMRIKRLFELIRLLSDDGAEGGRGSASGKSRKLDVHGTVTMAATTSEEWRPQDRSRITLLSVRPFTSRSDRPPAPPEILNAQLQVASKSSAGLRARAIALWPLFQANLKVARAAILAMGGQPRDADQLGQLVAGWWTMISDQVLTEDDDLERFRPFIVSLVEREELDDEPTICLETILGSTPDKWIGGERVTIGQLIAMGRDPDNSSARRALLPYGLMLMKLDGESWPQAWLAIANRHPGLDGLLSSYPEYQGKKRRQILGELRREIDGVVWTAKKSESHARIGGTQTRYVLIPPPFLPSGGEEQT